MYFKYIYIYFKYKYIYIYILNIFYIYFIYIYIYQIYIFRTWLMNISSGYFNSKNFSPKWGANYFKMCIIWQICHSGKEKKKASHVYHKDQSSTFYSELWCSDIKKDVSKGDFFSFLNSSSEGYLFYKAFSNFSPSLITLSIKRQIIN